MREVGNVNGKLSLLMNEGRRKRVTSFKLHATELQVATLKYCMTWTRIQAIVKMLINTLTFQGNNGSKVSVSLNSWQRQIFNKVRRGVPSHLGRIWIKFN